MPFQIIRNDITKVKADIIVNTANPHVRVGSGVDSAIYKAAGYDQLIEARRKIGELKPGEAGITEAFDLKAKWIIHVCGPVWYGGLRQEEKILRCCYDRALKLAQKRKCHSIAFPLISTGAYRFPKEIGLQIAINAFTDFLENHDMEIILVVFESEAVHISGRWVDEVKSFIDDEYTETYQQGGFCGSSFISQENNEDKQNSEQVEFKGWNERGSNLDDILKGVYKESFGKHVQRIIDKKGLKNSNVYAAANISKQYFSKLLKDQVNPSKGKVLALAIGLHLNLKETEEFLKLAGYALSPISQTDKVVEYFIKNEDYNVIKINIVLFDYGLSPLSE